MIDPTLRNLLIADLGAKPQVRVLLLDVVIGFGATADPAASLVSAWQKACAARSDNQPSERHATVTGTNVTRWPPASKSPRWKIRVGSRQEVHYRKPPCWLRR